MTEHTPTPWRIDPDSEYYAIVTDDEAMFPVTESTVCNPRQAANADRIVACVNACEGLTNEQLAKYNLAAVPELVEIAKSYKDVCYTERLNPAINQATTVDKEFLATIQAQMAKWEAELGRVTEVLKNIEASQ